MGIIKYKNPPVVEAWIDFCFEYGEEASEWDEKVAVDFLNSLDEFKQEEYFALVKKEVKTSERGPILSDSAPILQRLKAFSKEAKDRCLQVEQNLLVYNMLRKKDVEWPGFAVLLAEALPFCQKYIDRFHPVNVKPVLHYRDNVTIPFVDGKIEPRDYFEIYPNVSEEKFGNIGDFSLSLFLADICENGFARFSVRTEQLVTGETQDKVPFILDWYVESVNSFDNENLDMCKEWLILAHEGINKAFENCLTERCRSLFE